MCRLQEEYPQWFEKPVLEMVHHNTVSLDKLVEMAWVEILTKFAVDEECDFLVSLNLCISKLSGYVGCYVTLHLDLMMTPAFFTH